MKHTHKFLGGLMILAIVGVMFALPSDMTAPAGVTGRSATGSAVTSQEVPGLEQWVSEPVAPTLTQAVRDLPAFEVKPQLDREINPRLSTNDNLDPDFRVKSGIDPLLAIQEAAPEASADGFDTPIFNFDGEGYQFLNPPDTNGDVGANHYIQMINATVVSIYNKNTGALIQRFDLTTLGGCTTGSGDPVVLYDQLADRWFLSEFGPGSSLCVLISQTADPQGAYYSYQFNTPSFPDYPKYGVWPDAYYATANESSPSALALDRVKMLAGQPATAQRFTAPSLSGFPFQALTPADLDGLVPPPAGAPGIIMRHRDTEVHGPAGHPGEDFLEMWAFHVDWATPANSTFTQLPDIAVAEFSSDLCGLSSFSCIPQPGTSTELDPLREVIMFRLAYRNFGDHQALVGNFVTDVNGNDLAGVRWFELTSPPATSWSLYQEGTYSPDSTNRWMGAIAMDGSGNIALGYNVSDATSVYPGIRYVGRLVSDPLGTMPQGEYTLVDGTASNGSNRYGDYSDMVIDPIDDCTFWFTGEYNTSSQWSTRIGAFRFDACGSTDFAMDVVPDSLQICAPADATYAVNTVPVGGFTGDVSLAAIGNPGSAAFSPNPVTPPGSSALVISGAGAGTYSFDVVGTSVITPSLVHTETVGLDVVGAAPAAPVLTSPANGAINIGLMPTFMWNAAAGASSYSIEVATDAAFTNVVASASGLAGTSWVSNVTLNTTTTYFWRVWAENACGTGAYSATWSFTTQAGPGDCAPGSTPNILFSDDFESGAPGWTTPGGIGANTWALGAGVSGTPHSGSFVYHADDVNTVSEQFLVSPAVALPTGQNPVTLKFWNYQEIEDGGAGCYDGGLLEVSTNGGGSWTQVPDGDLLTDPYDGPIDSGFSNPRAGDLAWCGDPQPWLNSIVDVSAYAGQTVQFRWVMATDSSVSHPGWDVDDVLVQSCVVPTAVTLSSVDASAAQSPVPLAGLPLGAVAAAGMAGAALAVGYVSRRRNR